MQMDIPVKVDYARAGVKTPERPTVLNLYRLPAIPELPDTSARPLVIVLPGGAYCNTSPREAEPAAMKFIAAGMHAAVLHYSITPNRYPAAALEVAWCIQECRRNAKEWNIDPDAIYIMGFSAGGHLCATVGTTWNDPVFHEALDSDVSWRPDAQLLCYPVITLGKYTHEGSRINLLGEDATVEQIEALSMENRVSADTVPTFIWSMTTDEVVPVENTMMYAAALQRHHIPFELHIYEQGRHGTSTNEPISVDAALANSDNATWVQHAVRFVQRRS